MAAAGIESLGSVDGLFFDQDRVIVTHGRMANPRLDEFIMDQLKAYLLSPNVVTQRSWTSRGLAGSQTPRHPTVVSVKGRR
jgi:hypothetical protein